MLDPASTLKANILALSPTMNEIQGLTDLVNVIGTYMDQVQGGSGGTVGIFTLNEPVIVAALSSLQPVNDNSWVTAFANAFQTGISTAVIAPSTVTDATWIGSGNLDVNTLPTGAATITTIPLAIATLTSNLNGAQPDETAPEAMAVGFHDSTLDFIFNCIGLGTPPGLVPIPILKSAL